MADSSVKIDVELDAKGIEERISKLEKAISSFSASGKNSLNEFGDAELDAAKKTSTFGDVLKANLAAEAIKVSLSAIVKTIKSVGSAASSFINESASAATAAAQSHTMLTTVMRNVQGATADEVAELEELAVAQEKVGVVSKTAQVTAMAELASFVERKEAIADMLPVMNDYVAYQYGTTASEEQARNVATALGKAIQGNIDGLAKQGFTLSENDKAWFKTANEADRVRFVMDMVSESMGGVNEALAQTDAGKMAQLETVIENTKIAIGSMVNEFKAQVLGQMLPSISTMADALTGALQGKVNFSELTKAFDDVFSELASILDKALPLLATLGTKLVTAIVKGIMQNAGKMGDAIINSLTPVLGSGIGGALKSLWTTVSSLASAAFSVLKTAASAAGVALNVLSAIIKGISAAFNALKPVIIAVVSGFVALKVVTAAQTAISGITTAISLFTKGATLSTAATNLLILSSEAKTAADIKSAVASSGATIAETAHAAIVGVLSGNISIATAAQMIWNAVMAANPIGLIIAGVVALIAALASLVSWLVRETAEEAEARKAVEDLTEANKRFKDSMDERNKAFEDSQKEMTGNRTAADGFIKELFSMTEAEKATVGGQARMQSAIKELNKLYPSLNLGLDSYNRLINTQTGKVYEGEAAIHSYMDAYMDQIKLEALRERLIELTKAQMDLDKNSAEADIAYAKARQVYYDAQGNILKSIFTDYKGHFNDAAHAFSEAKQMQLANQRAIDEAKQAIEDLTRSMNEASEADEEYRAALQAQIDEQNAAIAAVKAQTEAFEDAVEASNKMTDALSDTISATSKLSKASDTLKSALEEQKSTGALTIDTIGQLIDAGYAAALVIDEETGAVTLNADAYRDLTQAKIEEQLASAMSNRESLVSAMNEEIGMAMRSSSANAELAKSYYELAMSKKADIAGADAEIAVLKQLRDNVGKNVAATNKAKASSSSGSSSTKKDPEAEAAKKRVDAFNDAKKSLDHLQKMDLIDEQEYYKRLEEARDTWLDAEKDVSEYQSVMESVHSYEKKSAEEAEKQAKSLADAEAKAAEEAAKAVEGAEKEKEAARKEVYEQSKKLVDQYIAAEKKYTDALSSRTKELSNSYSLFSAVEQKAKVSAGDLAKNLQDQITALRDWQQNINALAERGVSGELLDRLRAQGVSASAEIEALAKMSDTQLQDYMDKFQELQDLAAEQAAIELEPLRIEVDSEKSRIASELQSIADDGIFTALGADFSQDLLDGLWQTVDESTLAHDTGAMVAEGYAQGIDDNIGIVEAAVMRMTDATDAAARASLEIHSPSRKFAELGMYSAEGLAKGFDDDIVSVYKQMQASIEKNQDKLLAPAMRAVTQAQSATPLNAEVPKAVERNRASGQAGEAQEVAVKVGIDPNLNEFARILRPYIERENKRLGGAYGR